MICLSDSQLIINNLNIKINIMYEGKKEEVRPEYLNIAMNMAETIIELDPVLQNEIIHTIVNIIKENRHQLIDDAKKQLSYVKDSMQSLNEH